MYVCMCVCIDQYCFQYVTIYYNYFVYTVVTKLLYILTRETEGAHD